MRFRKKLLWIILSAILIAIASFSTYIWFSKSENKDPFIAIPNDAIYIIETSDLTKGWSTISNSKMWTHMRTNAYFEDISKSAASLDSLIKDNPTMDMLFSNRQMLISAHMISGNDYDFLFVINMKQASKIVFVKDYLKQIVQACGYVMNKRNFKGQEIIELKDIKTKEILHITFIDNLFVASYTPILVENAFLQKDMENWLSNTSFKKVSTEISSNKLFNFYINYRLIAKYTGVYLSEESDLVNSLSEIISYSALNVNFEDERFRFAGYTNLPDSISSYLSALQNVSPGKADAFKIASDKTAVYFSMCFDNFDAFYENLTLEFSKNNTNKFEDYSEKVKKIENYLKINLNEDFFSWIGNEIVLTKHKPVSNAKEEDLSIFIHAKNMDDAKNGLEKLSSQIKKKSPLKFETITYKDYTINYLDIKGFFKMFFGKLFGKLTKPYYCIIDNYVVFSNSPSTLMDIIDDYLNKNTLENNEEFISFLDNFEKKSNVSIFIRMPEMYSHLYYYSKADKRIGISHNKDLILSFSKVGFQLVSTGTLFKTSLLIEHNEDALYNEELENIENAAEELFLSDYDSLKFKPNLSFEELQKEGLIDIRYDNNTIKYEGFINKGNINGLFKTYYTNGNIASEVLYVEGKINGKAIFYYDSEEKTIRAEMTFNENEKIEDLYTEYYENGEKKAILELENGIFEGDASFYYDSGILKMEGSYKNGEKKGKWKYYTEDGNMLDKETWKKGQQKKRVSNESE